MSIALYATRSRNTVLSVSKARLNGHIEIDREFLTG